MRKIDRYITISSNKSNINFDEAVNKAISAGYAPYGSPYSVYNGSAAFLCQAMVMYEKESCDE